VSDDETFAISLGGKNWSIPHLPFRAIKKIQPALLNIYADLGGAEMSLASVARLGEAQLERLAEAAWLAISHVDASLTREQFFDLPFSVAELMRAFPAVAQAAGLRAGSTVPAGRQEAPGE
jgi:hypothetical protein